jgi:peptidoglycan-N-acetylglucosamine deacetylase
MRNLLNRRHFGSAVLGAAGSFWTGRLGAATGNLGTSRILPVNSTGGPRFGLKSYSGSLGLGPKEVVLTFDDGPLPGPTNQVLEALAREGVKATYFLIGRNAAANPAFVQRIAAAGHTIGNHTQNHRWTLRNLSRDAGWAEIETGAATIRRALGNSGTLAPFFRFPGFADTPALLEDLARSNTSVWGTDLWASDWNMMSADTQLALVLGRLERAGRGMLLFHDTRPQTAAMMPAFLRELRERGYRVVHTVPA